MNSASIIRPQLARRPRAAVMGGEALNIPSNLIPINSQKRPSNSSPLSNFKQSDIIKEEKQALSSDSEPESDLDNQSEETPQNQEEIIEKRPRLNSVDVGLELKNKLEESKNFRKLTVQELSKQSSLNSANYESGKITLEDIIRKKQQIAEKVDSFLAKSRLISKEEDISESDDDYRNNSLDIQKRQENIKKLEEKSIEKYKLCKNSEKELIGLLQKDEPQEKSLIDFELVLGRRGAIKTQSSYSVNYSKYMTDPEGFKIEESNKKRINYYDHEEFCNLEKSIRRKLSGISDETAIDIMTTIYPQLSNIFDSYISFSAAFNYLFQNWRNIVTNPNPSKSLKNTKVPSLVTALFKEAGSVGINSEDKNDQNSQVIFWASNL